MVPVGQVKQAEDDVEPVFALYEPAGQLAQAVESASERYTPCPLEVVA